MSPLSHPSWYSRYPIHFQLIEVVVSAFSPVLAPVGNDGTLILFPQPQHLFLPPHVIYTNTFRSLSLPHYDKLLLILRLMTPPHVLFLLLSICLVIIYYTSEPSSGILSEILSVNDIYLLSAMSFQFEIVYLHICHSY